MRVSARQRKMPRAYGFVERAHGGEARPPRDLIFADVAADADHRHPIPISKMRQARRSAYCFARPRERGAMEQQRAPEKKKDARMAAALAFSAAAEASLPAFLPGSRHAPPRSPPAAVCRRVAFARRFFARSSLRQVSRMSVRLLGAGIYYSLVGQYFSAISSSLVSSYFAAELDVSYYIS